MTYFIIGTTLLSKDSNTTWSVIKNEVFKGGMGGPNCKGERVDVIINPSIYFTINPISIIYMTI